MANPSVIERVLSVVLVALLATTRAPAQDWLIGATNPNETVSVTADMTVNGDIIISNNGHLNLTDAALTIAGDILVQDNATFEMTGGAIRFQQAFAFQRGMGVTNSGTVQLTNATVDGDGVSYSIALSGNTNTTLEGVTVNNGFATWVLWDDAALTIRNCTNAGEFVPIDRSLLNIIDSDTVLFWLTLPDGSIIDTTLPPPGSVGSWSVNPSVPWGSGIFYTASVTNCTTVWWAVNARSGCDGTIRDATLLTVGSYFNRANIITIQDLSNGQFLTDTSYAWGDVSLRFMNTSVQTWSYYCSGTTTLTLERCVFGELIVDQAGQAMVADSLCDGSGGYVAAFDTGRLWLLGSTNLAQTTTSENATLIAIHSSLLSPAIDATGNSVMKLSNTGYAGEPTPHDGATVFDVTIDPVEATAGSPVPLRGTARSVTGPTSPFSLASYVVEYGVGNAPTEWLPAAGPFTQGVVNADLGIWDTSGLTPGVYALRVSILPNLGDPVIATTTASLGALPVPAVSEWGIAIMAGLILCAGTLQFRKPPTHDSAE